MQFQRDFFRFQLRTMDCFINARALSSAEKHLERSLMKSAVNIFPATSTWINIFIFFLFIFFIFLFFSYKFIEGISTIEETDYKFTFEIKVTQPDRIFFKPIIYCPGIALSVRLVDRLYLQYNKYSIIYIFITLHDMTTF